MTASTRAQRQIELLRQNLVEVLGHVVDTCLELRPEDYPLPVGLPGWDLRLHTALAVWQLTEMASQLEHPTATRPVTIDRYAAHMRATAALRQAQAAEIADGESGPRLTELLVARADEVSAAVREGSLPPLVDTGAGQLSLTDYLRVHVTEIVVYADDVHLALTARGRRPPQVGRGPVATAVRALADVLAGRAPGRAIEVRIPPYAAVQIGDPAAADGGLTQAPTHTRGTPPAVIEMDATTFLRLASGRLAWAGAVSGHAVRASGLRTDLSPMLPLMG